MKRILLGVAAMIGVQICFGIASELFAIGSLPALLALVLVGLIAASACGAFVAKRRFVIASVCVLAVDFALCFYALRASYSFLSLLASIWPLICGGVVAVVLGAKLGELVGRSGTTATT